MFTDLSNYHIRKILSNKEYTLQIQECQILNYKIKEMPIIGVSTDISKEFIADVIPDLQLRVLDALRNGKKPITVT